LTQINRKLWVVSFFCDVVGSLSLKCLCHAGTEQSRWSKAEELRIDQDQCRRLKDYYGFDHPKCWGSRLPQPSKPLFIVILPGNAQRRGYDSAGTRILDTHL
jgi:hypothetical protein